MKAIKLKNIEVFLVFFFLNLYQVWAQTDSAKTQIKPDRPLKFFLNEEESHFFQLVFLNQTWVRWNESNPGSTVMGEKAEHTFDIGLRRTRVQMLGQITDRAFLYFQFGMNNFNFLNGYSTAGGNRKIGAFFHDALGEYKIFKGNELKLGGGLTIANGLSRFSQPSIGTILALDVPVFAQATVDQTDEFSRKLSIYARGQVHHVDYRFAISDPFPIQSNGASIAPIDVHATFSGKRHHKQYQGYLLYQFFDHENHLTPYMTGAHLGTKKVFNIGGGIIFQKDAMWRKDGLDTLYQNMMLWSMESFLDLPVNKLKGTALTAYAGYFNYDFGRNYIRTQAQMNPADALVSLIPSSPYSGSVSRSGNGWPMMGTGTIYYTQLGYLFPRTLLGNHGTLQPYFTYQLNDFERLKDKVNVYHLGVNWLMNGHKSKLSLDYQNRPVFKSDHSVGTRKGCLILQYQVSI